MIKYTRLICFISCIIILVSCEEVIKVGLNSSEPVFVVEAAIGEDTVALVRLTRTADYFSNEEPPTIDDATVKITDGFFSEELIFKGNGYYSGKTIKGITGRTYGIEILSDNKVYNGTSYMYHKPLIESIDFVKDNSQTIYNPNGETVFTITCKFIDDPDAENFYMMKYVSGGELVEKNFFMLTENSSNGGFLTHNFDNTISFSESIFYDGGTIDVQVFAIDKSIYDYFLQLNDILFWKRRYMPPTPYNPKSNLTNGALGYFAAWAFDTRRIILE
jgi:hypothetical protein